MFQVRNIVFVVFWTKVIFGLKVIFMLCKRLVTGFWYGQRRQKLVSGPKPSSIRGVFLMVIFHQFINSNHSDFPLEIIYCPCFLLLTTPSTTYTRSRHRDFVESCIFDLGLTLLALNTISWFIYKHLQDRNIEINEVDPYKNPYE